MHNIEVFGRRFHCWVHFCVRHIGYGVKCYDSYSASISFYFSCHLSSLSTLFRLFLSVNIDKVPLHCQMCLIINLSHIAHVSSCNCWPTLVGTVSEYRDTKATILFCTAILYFVCVSSSLTKTFPPSWRVWIVVALLYRTIAKCIVCWGLHREIGWTKSSVMKLHVDGLLYFMCQYLMCFSPILIHTSYIFNTVIYISNTPPEPQHHISILLLALSIHHIDNTMADVGLIYYIYTPLWIIYNYDILAYITYVLLSSSMWKHITGMACL